MTTAIGSEPLIPVVSSPSSPVQAGPALPVYVYTSLPAGRSQSGAKPIPVKFLSASDLVQNGGSYTLAGPPTALPVISVAANTYGVQGGSALPVYDVTNLVYPQPQPSPAPAPPASGLLLDLQVDALALADGDPVSTWADASGLGHDFSQTGSARPTYIADDGDGFPCVRFGNAGQTANAGQFMASTAWGDGIDSYAILTLVRSAQNQQGAQGYILCNVEPVNFTGWSLIALPPAQLVDTADPNFNVNLTVSTPPAAIEAYYVVTAVRLDQNAAHAYADANRTGETDSSTIPSPPSSTGMPVEIGAAGDGQGTGYAIVKIRAIQMYSPAPDEATLLTLCDALLTRYGLSRPLTPPVLVSAEVGNVDAKTLVMVFDQNVNFTVQAFTLNVNGTPAVFVGVTRQTNHAIVYWGFNTPVIHTDVLDLSCSGSIYGDGGLVVAAFGPVSVTNNVP